MNDNIIEIGPDDAMRAAQAVLQACKDPEEAAALGRGIADLLWDGKTLEHVLDECEGDLADFVFPLGLQMGAWLAGGKFLKGRYE